MKPISKILAALLCLAATTSCTSLCNLRDPQTGRAIPAQFTGTVGAVRKDHALTPGATLTKIDTVSCEGYDRAVFTFSGGVPGYRAEYVDRPVRECGSGEPVPVAGDALLQINFTPAQAHTDAGQPTLPSRRIPLNKGNLREMVSTCDFEGHVEWVIGVGSPNRFRVTELQNPPRVVVDVKR